MSNSHRVIVSSVDDEEHDRVYRCSGSVTAAEILERWTNDLGLSKRAANLRRPKGAFYRPQDLLFRPGSSEKMAEVIAELCWRLRVALGPEQEREVPVSPAATPREIMGPLRAAFGLSDTRPMRLTIGDVALRPDESLAAQGVRGGEEDKLRLELGFSGVVTEAVSGFLRPFLLFASEPASRLAKPWLPEECRIGVRCPAGALTAVALDGDVGAALGAVADPEAAQLELEVRQGVAVLTEGHARPQVVPAWASAAVGSLFSALEPPPKPVQQPSLMAGAQVADAAAVGAGEGALLSAGSVPVKLWLKRCCRLLRLPIHCAVADLRAAATAALGLPPNGAEKATLRVKRGRTVEEEEDPRQLAAFCVEHGDSFCADKPPPVPRASRPHLSVLLASGRQFDFPLAPGELLRFGDVVSRLASASGKPRADFRFRVFRCRGCGRGLEVDEEEFQVLPSPCCRQRSLNLAERRMVSVGVQSGPTEQRRCDQATNTCEVKSQRKNVSIDVRPKTADKSVNAVPKKPFKSFGTQTKKAEPGLSRNAPEPKPRAVKPPQKAPEAQALVAAAAAATNPGRILPQHQQPPQALLPTPTAAPNPGRILPQHQQPPQPLVPAGAAAPNPGRILPQHQQILMPQPLVPAAAAAPNPGLMLQQHQQPPQPQAFGQMLLGPSPQQQRSFEALRRQEAEKWRQEAQLEQLMARNPGLQAASAQRRTALEQQLGPQGVGDQRQDAAARSQFQQRLNEEAAAVERQRQEAERRRQAEASAEAAEAAEATAAEARRRAREAQFAQKFRQPEQGGYRHAPRPGYIPASPQEEFRPRGRQRQPETRQEKRQRRLQELREQFEAEQQKDPAGPAGGFHDFAITSLIRGRPDFTCRLRLPAAPCVAHVRRELGLEMEVPPARLRLRRCSVLYGDRRLFRVEKGAPGSRVFGGPDGTTCVVNMPSATEVHFLDEDSEPFPLVPGEVCVLEVSRQN